MPKNSTECAIELLRSCGATCSPTILAKAIGGSPYYYNLAARDGTLQFPHIWRGRNLRIFTEPVIRILKGDTTS